MTDKNKLLEAGWERTLRNVVVLIGRLALAYLFFANIWWKLPPTFSCSTDFVFRGTAANGDLDDKGEGLCKWIGIESHYANKDRTLLQADLIYAGGPNLGVNIKPLAMLNGAFLDNVVKPNIRWFGYIIFYSEAAIAVLMFLGLFSRLGGLIGLGISSQLMIGLANIPYPFEWEWGYNLMVVLSLLMIGLAPGRFLGLDVIIRRILAGPAHRGSKLARLVLAFT